jgi:hypothetical protein
VQETVLDGDALDGEVLDGELKSLDLCFQICNPEP